MNFFRALRIWYRRRQRRAAAKRFNAGYRYTIGELEAGRCREALWAEASNPFDSDEFEQGMKTALRTTGKPYV